MQDKLSQVQVFFFTGRPCGFYVNTVLSLKWNEAAVFCEAGLMSVQSALYSINALSCGA